MAPRERGLDLRITHLWVAASWMLAACSSSPAPSPRAFKVDKSCPVTGATFGAAIVGIDVVVSQFELDRVAQLRLSDCTERQSWRVPGGPKAVARYDDDLLAVMSSQGLSILTRAGGTQTLATAPAPNALHVAPDPSGGDQLFATLGSTAAEAHLIRAKAQAGALIQLDDLALSGASAVTAVGAEVWVARTTEQKLTAVRLENGKLTLGADLPVCADPFAVTFLGQTLVTTCRTGGLELLRPSDAGYVRQRLLRDGTLYDTVAIDLDLDGQPDLASVDPFGHKLVVWWGGADGGFDGPQETATGRGPILLRSFDFDTDGRPELLVLAFQDRSVTVFRTEGKTR